MSVTVKEIIEQLQTFPQDANVRLGIEEVNASLGFEGLGTATSEDGDVDVVFVISLKNIFKFTLWCLSQSKEDAEEESSDNDDLKEAVKSHLNKLNDVQKKILKQLLDEAP